MSELNRKFKNRTLRIAIFSLGGILIVAGIILAGWGIKLLLTEGVVSDCIFVSVISLTAGICICILSVTVPRYIAKTREMSVEEKVIENIKLCMKQRKSHITAIAFVVILYIFVFILLYLQENRLTETSEDMKLLNLAKVIVLEYFILGLTGLMISTLIIEISGLKRNKHMLTVNMWERIQQLEDEVKKLKDGTRTNDQE